MIQNPHITITICIIYSNLEVLCTEGNSGLRKTSDDIQHHHFVETAIVILEARNKSSARNL